MKKKFKLVSIITFILLIVLIFLSLNYSDRIADLVNKYDLIPKEKILKFTRIVFPWANIGKLERDNLKKQKKILNYEKKIEFLEKNHVNQELVSFIEHELKHELYLVNYNEEEIYDKQFKIKKITNKILKKQGPRSYLRTYQDKLFLITGTGLLMYSKDDVSNLFDNQVSKFIKIPSNFKEIVGEEYILKDRSIVKSFIIKNDQIYLSYFKKLRKKTSEELSKYTIGKNKDDNCYNLEILRSDPIYNFKNLEKVKFNNFITFDKCVPWNTWGSGGHLTDYKEDKILYTVGDMISYENSSGIQYNWPQEIDNIFGKILSINIKTKKYKILSIGHRNSQGIFYYKNINGIFNTEHGPEGGDELNLNLLDHKTDKYKNYGWGKASYGEHYKTVNDPNNTLKKISPLYKSHKDHGFIEPLKQFTPSVAPTSIVVTSNFVDKENYNIEVYFGSLGHNNDGDRRSLHQIILDNNLNILKHRVVKLNQRVRDVIFDKNSNMLILYLEYDGSIAFLKPKF